MAKLSAYLEAGQSIWLDDIRRDYFTHGELARLVAQGLRGLTSNPSIFEKAINGSRDYDLEMAELVHQGKNVQQIYEALIIGDIREAADVLRPVYEQSGGADGFVSLEVRPILAHDSDGTIEEALRLFKVVNRPNLMIKIPATPAGLPAIQAVLEQGVNVNVTLIFSVRQYEKVVEAYLAGLEGYLEAGGDLSKIASVASFFVSRLDGVVDKLLEKTGEKDLQGKIAVANSKVAYACFRDLFSGQRWERLAAQGARLQRPLWASTSTKNPAYSDTLYVDALVGPHTVNTLPYTTLEAVLDHGSAEPSIGQNLETALHQIARLGELGIDLNAITEQLQVDGVAAFSKSFETLLESITRKSGQMRQAQSQISVSLGQFQAQIDAALAEMAAERLVPRLWEKDYTLWKPEPTEISNRLGWLHSPAAMMEELSAIEELVQSVRQDGYTHALLLGMGGSSLAPEVLSKTFGARPGYLNLEVLDSTDPAAVLDHSARLDPRKTLYIVSTKSGGTVETISFFKYFYNQVALALGEQEAGAHFIAITDPGSQVAEMAARLHFRAVFLNDPQIGGRYSALSHFGLAPAALVGIDLPALLQRAQNMAALCAIPDPFTNPGARLGAILGELSRQGRDKLTLIISADVCTFGDWVEQLVAESTGKEGKGILPVVGEVVGGPNLYGNDRCFIWLRMAQDNDLNGRVQALESAGHPVIRLVMEDALDLGAQFFLWEFATAVAGQRLGIQPFDQPNVEAAKVQARKMITAYQDQGTLPELRPALQANGLFVYGEVVGNSLEEVWRSILQNLPPNGYIAIQAYLPPSQVSDASLLALRTELRSLTKLAVTTGYGPRFLHSTGQLHKGDAGRGLFIQITTTHHIDAPIPDLVGEIASSLSFGILELAQSLGDRQALLERGRKVIRFHIEKDIQIGIARLIHALKG